MILRISQMRRLIILFLVIFEAVSQNLRPIRDDVGYCWNFNSMGKLIDYLQTIDSLNVESGFVAAISPHDDYLYAAPVYFPVMKNIKVDEIIIFGVTHSSVRKSLNNIRGKIILDDYSSWQGLVSEVGISPLREFIKSKLDTSFYTVSNQAHMLEHSIESQIPFLNFYNQSLKITPIMVTEMDFNTMKDIAAKLGNVISEYIKYNNLKLGENIIVLISSDANHYGTDFNNIPYGEDDSAHIKAIDEDMKIIRNYLEGKLEEKKVKNFVNEMKNVVWCGKYSIPFGLLTLDSIIKKVYAKPLVGKLIRYSDTYSDGVLPLKKLGIGTTAPFSLKHWVGFFSMVFYYN